MSGQRRRRGGRHTPRAVAEGFAELSAEARGCTCDPHVELHHDAPGITRVTIAHDPWCPVVGGTGEAS